MSHDEKPIGRRQILTAGLGVLSAGVLVALPASAAELNPDEGVTAPEDLMKEHGVLDRCLLAYEEGMRRVQNHDQGASDAFHHVAGLVQRFVEGYHERNEEKYIFPVFIKHGKLTDLVHTLLAQHHAGRVLTQEILSLSRPDAFNVPSNRDRLMTACRGFIHMYRPHAAREDTILFPALRTLLSAKQVAALGDRMEEDEHRVLGDQGFEKAVAEIAEIEKSMNIYRLEDFTPRVSLLPHMDQQ